MMKYDVYWLSREIKNGPERRTKNCFRTSGWSQAAYLLTSSAVPVTDIIESVGYDNTSYFTGSSGRYGMSPKEYRERNRGE